MLREEIEFFKNNGYLRYPKILQLEITNICPLNCPQCYKDCESKYINYNMFKALIDEASDIGIGSIMINGGEPTCHPDFIDIIKYISEKKMTAYCFLSGLNINDKMISELEKESINISISLNGSKEEVNSLSRDGYKFAINALKNLKKSNIDYGINWVARSDNVRDFVNVIDLAKKYNAKHINIIANKISSGRLQSEMTKDDFIILKKYIEENSSGVPIRVESCFSIMSAFLNYNKPILFKGCNAGVIVCFVNADGIFMPCSHLYYPEKFHSIKEYWENSLILSELRKSNDMSKLYCDDCIYEKKCKVCKAISTQTHDNFSIGYEKCSIKVNKER